MCKKVTYNTRKQAWVRALYYFKNLGTYQSPYRCPRCRHFHTTASLAQFPPPKFFREQFNEWFGIEVI